MAARSAAKKTPTPEYCELFLDREQDYGEAFGGIGYRYVQGGMHFDAAGRRCERDGTLVYAEELYVRRPETPQDPAFSSPRLPPQDEKQMGDVLTRIQMLEGQADERGGQIEALVEDVITLKGRVDELTRYAAKQEEILSTLAEAPKSAAASAKAEALSSDPEGFRTEMQQVATAGFDEWPFEDLQRACMKHGLRCQTKEQAVESLVAFAAQGGALP